MAKQPQIDEDEDQIKYSYIGSIRDHSIIGDIGIAIYIVVWVSSLLSPLILIMLLLNRYYYLSIFIILIMIISYSPSSMDKYLHSPSIRSMFYYTFSKYYKNISLGWIAGSKPYSRQDINNLNCTNAIPTLLCFHPHGIFTQTWGWLFLAPETDETVFMFANSLYISPFFRLLCRFCGNPSGCDKKSMKNIMKSKQNCAIVPGGFQEASIHSNKVDRIYLKKRKGFVKYAIQYGYSLTPIFGFNEKDTYYNVPGCWNLRLWLNNCGIPAILPFGRLFCPILPRNNHLHVVVGKPLLPPKLKNNQEITKEIVNKHHAIYVKRIQELHEKYSKVYYKEKSQLEIW